MGSPVDVKDQAISDADRSVSRLDLQGALHRNDRSYGGGSRRVSK